MAWSHAHLHEVSAFIYIYIYIDWLMGSGTYRDERNIVWILLKKILPKYPNPK